MNLSVQACSDKICMLERRVNNAVLKLTLKVFSEYKELIEKIQKHCFDFSNVEQPIAEFACLIEDHDIQVDRIIQIGLFAVSCSTDKSSRYLEYLLCLDEYYPPHYHTHLCLNL